jgi:hypothetical protein
MLRLLNKLFAIILFAVISFSFVSCGFADLRHIEVHIEPEEMDSVLPDQYSPVIIKFNTGMIHNEAEEIVQVFSDLGTIKGDKFWRENELYFLPVSGWTPGIRYTLSLAGTIHSYDGRETRLERYVSFYAVNKNIPPLLEWHSPLNGASAGINNITFEFHFSQSMDRLSAETAIVLEGIGNKNFNWSSDDKMLTVTTDKALTPWLLYRWNIKDTAKSKDGVHLPKTYTGYFTTDLDQVLPYVADIYPVINFNGSWYPTGARIETGLEYGDGIAVSFNKPMGENALKSIRFEPSLTGRTEFLSENSIVYIFTKSPEPETVYSMTILSDTKDSEDLKIGTDYKINFTPNIPYLSVLSFIVVESNTYINDFSIPNKALPVNIDPAEKELSFSIRFSLPFGTEEKQNILQKITLTPFFPKTLSPVALKDIKWISNDRLYMRWEGITVTENANPSFYKILIPGGKNGISSETGIFMKEDMVIYLEAVK